MSAGDGTGTGRDGNGVRSGGAGSGSGAGTMTRARLLSGAITSRDYPKQERAARIGGSVTATFLVGTDGRAHGCVVTGSSGNATLDATTCRLIETRFRYAPALDPNGLPVSEQRGWRQRWWLE